MNQHSKQLGEEATGNGPLKRRVRGDLADWCPGSQMNREGSDKEDQERESGCVQCRTEVTGVCGLAISGLCLGNFCGQR